MLPRGLLGRPPGVRFDHRGLESLRHRKPTGRAAEVHKLDWAPADTDKGDFEHYMLKEIYEQPEVLERALAGRFDQAEATAHFGGLNIDPSELRQIDRVIMTACGTSYHAALIGESLFEQFARIPVEVEYASEFRYRNPPLEKNTVVLGITQSGETADTLAALRESKRKGLRTLALCNVVGSTIAREADGGVYIHAGPEIGVASTKAFTAQVTVLALLALYLGRMRHLSHAAGLRIIDELLGMPDILRQTLKCHDDVKRIAANTSMRPTCFTWAASTLPVGVEARSQTQGNQLYSRRGLPGGGNEARSDRPGG